MQTSSIDGTARAIEAAMPFWVDRDLCKVVPVPDNGRTPQSWRVWFCCPDPACQQNPRNPAWTKKDNALKKVTPGSTVSGIASSLAAAVEFKHKTCMKPLSNTAMATDEDMTAALGQASQVLADLEAKIVVLTGQA